MSLTGKQAFPAPIRRQRAPTPGPWRRRPRLFQEIVLLLELPDPLAGLAQLPVLSGRVRLAGELPAALYGPPVHGLRAQPELAAALGDRPAGRDYVVGGLPPELVGVLGRGVGSHGWRLPFFGRFDSAGPPSGLRVREKSTDQCRKLRWVSSVDAQRSSSSSASAAALRSESSRMNISSSERWSSPSLCGLRRASARPSDL